MRKCLPLALMLLLSACAGLDARSLQPGVASEMDVRTRLGKPAMTWREADGHQQQAFPRGPMGFVTWMAYLAPDGRLEKIENVLETRHFARIQPGQSPEQVLRILGPSVPHWSVYFKARDELVWEWRYCDDWSEPARFHVLFDATSNTVRSTLAMPERQVLPFIHFREYCGH